MTLCEGCSINKVQIQIHGCGVGVRGSRSLPFEGHSESGPYLFRLDFCVILLQSIWLLCNLFYN